MAIERPDVIWAGAVLAWAGGVPSFTTNRGFASLTDNGAGDVTLTFSPGLGIDANDATYAVTCRLATFAAYTLIVTDDENIRVRFWDAAGVALDNVPFDITVHRINV